MKISKEEFFKAATQAGLAEKQTQSLWQELERKPIYSKFDFSHLLYYFGALIVIIAMTLYIGEGWEKLGGKAIFSVALVYMIAFSTMGGLLWQRDHLKVSGGLFVTMAVCLIPLATYGLQSWLGVWPGGAPGHYQGFFSWVKGGWFFMEMATILGGCIALKFCPFPFLTMPIYFALWFMSMDITPLLFNDTLTARLWVSLIFGLFLMVSAYLIDRHTQQDFAFWGYLFGALAFWCGLSLMESHSEWKNLIYCLINISLVLLSILLQRVIFLILGAMGILGYITSLFYRHFANSIWFVILVSLIGVAINGAGIYYQRHRLRIESAILACIPKWAQSWLPLSRKS